MPMSVALRFVPVSVTVVVPVSMTMAVPVRIGLGQDGLDLGNGEHGQESHE